MKTILLTGGAGFIGSNFVELALERGHKVIVLDALTYAGHLENLAFTKSLEGSRYFFIKGNILDHDLSLKLLREHKVDWFLNFAAESHVDKSITGPKAFMETNVMGTFQLLTAAKEYFDSLDASKKSAFRFLHVSTDEVYGTLGKEGKFTETTPYQPNSPYSSSKAGSDHLVRAWFHTYGLPTITTNCSNNYGPKQFPEKLIPHMILCALSGKALPVYGKGENIRDWIHVKDHGRGILAALEKGVPGETYCFGGNCERTNLDVVKAICVELGLVRPMKGKKYESLIQFVQDRPGHDFRYAIDDSKAQRELGYKRQYLNFEQGLKDTVQWYLSNLAWVEKVTSKPGVKVKYDWALLGKTT